MLATRMGPPGLIFSQLLDSSLTSLFGVDVGGSFTGWGVGPEVGEGGGWGEPTGGPIPWQTMASSRSLPLQAGLLASAIGLAVEDELVGSIGQPVDGALGA